MEMKLRAEQSPPQGSLGQWPAQGPRSQPPQILRGGAAGRHSAVPPAAPSQPPASCSSRLCLPGLGVGLGRGCQGNGGCCQETSPCQDFPGVSGRRSREVPAPGSSAERHASHLPAAPASPGRWQGGGRAAPVGAPHACVCPLRTRAPRSPWPQHRPLAEPTALRALRQACAGSAARGRPDTRPSGGVHAHAPAPRTAPAPGHRARGPRPSQPRHAPEQAPPPG